MQLHYSVLITEKLRLRLELVFLKCKILLSLIDIEKRTVYRTFVIVVV
jgi:hypothetical protein